jgi:molybdate transport system substrate-binding protein
LLLLAALAAALAPLAARAQAAPTIAAASDLQSALPEIARAFEARTRQTVKLTFGSSGNFTQQIQNGAPYQVFLSADEAYVESLAKAGRTEGAGRLYAIGRIGLFVPRGSPLKPDASLRDLAAAARDGRLTRFAIANPEHAPYGRAAREALQASGAWPLVQPKLVLGENVSQATQFATSGSAQGGVIPLSLALTPQVKAAGAFVLIPAERHKPLRQRAVLIKGASPTARAFYDFLRGPEARAIFRKYGFVLPTER